jgi:beta-lactamase class A
LTAYARSLGDDVFQMDRTEPEITEAVPGDVRDTTSPRAWAADLQTLVLGDRLGAEERSTLIDLMRRNTTGADRIRAGMPEGWTVADRTGTGSYGTANDVAVLWTPDGEPIVLAVMTSRSWADARPVSALLADAASTVTSTLRNQAT